MSPSDNILRRLRILLREYLWSDDDIDEGLSIARQILTRAAESSRVSVSTMATSAAQRLQAGERLAFEERIVIALGRSLSDEDSVDEFAETSAPQAFTASAESIGKIPAPDSETDESGFTERPSTPPITLPPQLFVSQRSDVLAVTWTGFVAGRDMRRVFKQFSDLLQRTAVRFCLLDLRKASAISKEDRNWLAGWILSVEKTGIRGLCIVGDNKSPAELLHEMAAEHGLTADRRSYALHLTANPKQARGQFKIWRRDSISSFPAIEEDQSG